jgi:uncharacterized protein YoxC
MEPIALIRAGTALAIQVEPAHWTQIVTTVSVAVLALLGAGVAVAALLVLRSLRRLLRTLERTVQGLSPRAEPLIERAGRLAEDAGRIAGAVRREIEDVRETVDELNRQTRAVSRAVESRVRRFGTVLDVVQDETERLLLDATATARGVHATADAMRRRRALDGGELPPQPGDRAAEPARPPEPGSGEAKT